MTVTVCATWLARDFLARHRRDPGPACDHPHDYCPPITKEPR